MRNIYTALFCWQVNYLSKLTDLVRTNLSKVYRSKSVALITMEIHNRDVMERMIKKVM